MSPLISSSHFKMGAKRHEVLTRTTVIFLLSVTLLLAFLPCIYCKDSLVSRITPEHTENDNGEGDDEEWQEPTFYFDHRDDAIEALRPHYALDPRQTKKLAKMETTLIAVLSDVEIAKPKSSSEDGEEDLCLVYLSKYLAEYEQDTQAVNGQSGMARATMVAENPILTFKLIRRVVDSLLDDTINSCKDENPQVAQAIQKVFLEEDLVPPTSEDLDDALMGLLRIQYVYGLNGTSEVSLGVLNGIKTRAFLYFDDCLLLAKKSIELEAQQMAYQWLVAAPQSPPEVTSPQEHLNEDMWKLEQLWLKLLNMTLIGNWEDMHEKLRGQRQNELQTFFEYDYYATCRGEMTMAEELQKDLFCFYQTNWDPYFYINPVKTEVLSEDPVVVQVYEFVNNEALNMIKDIADKTMKRSGVISKFKAETDFQPYRTSMNAWVYDTEEQMPDPVLTTLNRRIEILTDLEVVKEGASNLQVALYGALGGHYDFHHDSLQGTKSPVDELGDRIATFLIFMNDVTSGGYTAFPDIGTFAKPIKGSAILWYSLKLSGVEDVRTIHGGCPVVLGSKEVANRWIMQYPNMWKHPCSLDPEE